jgi:hypothetical protein
MDKLNIEKIAEMSDDEILDVSVKRPHHPLGTGFYREFVLSLQDFENKQEMDDCLCVLKKRLAKIKKP